MIALDAPIPDLVLAVAAKFPAGDQAQLEA